MFEDLLFQQTAEGGSVKKGDRKVVVLYVFAFQLPSRDLAWLSMSTSRDEEVVAESKVLFRPITRVLDKGRHDVYKVLHSMGFMESAIGWVHFRRPQKQEVQRLKALVVGTIDKALEAVEDLLERYQDDEDRRQALARIADALKERRARAVEYFDVFPLAMRATDAAEVLNDAVQLLAREVKEIELQMAELEKQIQKRREERKKALLRYYRGRYEALARKLEEWQKFLEELTKTL